MRCKQDVDLLGSSSSLPFVAPLRLIQLVRADKRKILRVSTVCKAHLAFIWLQFHNFQQGICWVKPENETGQWLNVQLLSRAMLLVGNLARGVKAWVGRWSLEGVLNLWVRFY